MILLDAWKQTTTFEPDNPGQQVQEHYTGLPGGYSSFYWNRIPLKVHAIDGSLNGILRDSLSQSASRGATLIAVMGLLAVGLHVYNKLHDAKHRKTKQ